MGYIAESSVKTSWPKKGKNYNIFANYHISAILAGS